MHILVGLLVAAAGAFFAFRYFVDAAHEGRDALRDVKGFFRGARWSRKIDRRLIENLQDPREGAAVLLYQMAAYDGAVTERQRTAMVADMRKAFSADEETAQALFAFARMAQGEIHDAANSLRKILKPVLASCTEDEKKRLIDMLAKIGEVEGPLSEAQRRLVEEARRILFPK
jgi:uncharacterized tellurite resistance protein B-like protein